MVSMGRLEAELSEHLADVTLDRLELEPEVLRDARIGTTLGHQREDLPLAGRQLVECRVPPWPTQEPGDDLGIDDGSAGDDAADSIGEILKATHVVFEDIADPGGVIAKQLHRVARLDVLREHEDGDTRMSTPDDMRGLEAFRCVSGRHPDVDNDHVGRLALNRREETIDVARLPDHLEPSRGQAGGECLAQKGGIVCKDDPRTWMPLVGH